MSLSMYFPTFRAVVMLSFSASDSPRKMTIVTA
jgi:hypothetical protein